jgi:hypothetical protein
MKIFFSHKLSSCDKIVIFAAVMRKDEIFISSDIVADDANDLYAGKKNRAFLVGIGFLIPQGAAGTSYMLPAI